MSTAGLAIASGNHQEFAHACLWQDPQITSQAHSLEAEGLAEVNRLLAEVLRGKTEDSRRTDMQTGANSLVCGQIIVACFAHQAALEPALA